MKTNRKLTRKHHRALCACRLISLLLIGFLLLPSLLACTPGEESTTPSALENPTVGATTNATTATTAPATTARPTEEETTTAPPAVTENTLSEIQNAYYDAYLKDLTPDKLGVSVYAETEDGWIVTVDETAEPTDMTYEIIDNTEFLYDTEARLLFYRAGEFTPLADAYAEGAFDRTQLKELYAVYRAAKQELYDEYSPEQYVRTRCDDEDIWFPLDKIYVSLRPFATNIEFSARDFYHIGCTRLEYLSRDSMLLTISSDSEEALYAAIDALVAEERCEFREIDLELYGYALDAVPTDPLALSQIQLTYDYIHLTEAWDLTTGSQNVVVGVIDSGIDASHPDLTNRVNRTLSRDYTPDGDPFWDRDGHGTEVASIIGAQPNNAIGISGVCWNVQLVSLKVTNSAPGESDYLPQLAQNITNAIQEAETLGIDILNISLSSMQFRTNDVEAMRVAIEDFSGLIVCSAGNDSLDLDTKDALGNYVYQNYPACFDSANLITVGAYDTSPYYILPESNYGAGKVDIFASGYRVLCCVPTDLCGEECMIRGHRSEGYHTFRGTSAAAPVVTGVAALLLSYCPNLTSAQLRTRIIMHASPQESFGGQGGNVYDGKCVSEGFLDAYTTLAHCYDRNYTRVNDRVHTVKCICGDMIQEYHKFVFSGTTGVCVCGATIQMMNVPPKFETE